MEYRDYTLPGGMQTEILNIPKGFEIVDVQRSADHRIRLTALVDNQQPLEPARFKCIPSGTDLNACRSEGYSPIYLGTVQMLPAVWHVHELRAVPKTAESPVVDPVAVKTATNDELKDVAAQEGAAKEVDSETKIAADLPTDQATSTTVESEVASSTTTKSEEKQPTIKKSESKSTDTDSNPFNNK